MPCFFQSRLSFVSGHWLMPMLWSGGSADKIVKPTGWWCRLSRQLSGRASAAFALGTRFESLLGHLRIFPFLPNLDFPIPFLLSLPIPFSFSSNLRLKLYSLLSSNFYRKHFEHLQLNAYSSLRCCVLRRRRALQKPPSTLDLQTSPSLQHHTTIFHFGRCPRW